MRRAAPALAVVAAALIAATLPAGAQSRGGERASARAGDIRIGVGHGIGFLPLYLAHDLKLLEKHAKAAGIAARLSIQRFNAAAPLHQALTKGDIAAGAYGLPTLLLSRDSKAEMVAVSGLTTLPLVLVAARPGIASLADLKPNDRVAVPMITAPQTLYLRMQAEKMFWGSWNRLRQQIVAMPHQEALDAVASGKDNVAAYFSSPPFTQVALKETRLRPILASTDVTGGKTSFLVMAATKATLAAQPKLAEVVARAVDEAAAVIRSDPRRAATVYLKYEPSHSLDARAVEAILRDLKDDFGSGVYGVETMAAFMNRDGRLKNTPTRWTDVVAPALARGPGS